MWFKVVVGHLFPYISIRIITVFNRRISTSTKPLPSPATWHSAPPRATSNRACHEPQGHCHESLDPFMCHLTSTTSRRVDHDALDPFPRPQSPAASHWIPDTNRWKPCFKLLNSWSKSRLPAVKETTRLCQGK